MTAAEPLVTLRRNAADAPWTVAELAALTDRLLGDSGNPPGKPTTDRTVRFYVTRAVVQVPFGRGRGSSWGYPHLVELLAARLAQASGEGLDAIAERRSRLSPAALERYVASHFTAPLPAPSETEPQVGMPTGTGWRRFVVPGGAELHVQEDHPLLRNPRRLGAVLDDLAREVNPSLEER